MMHSMESTSRYAAPRYAAPRYAAPALEKGLDILEALADEPAGLAQQEIAARLDRSVGEIFRMLEVLVARGWLVRDAASARYALSSRMFALSHRHPPTRLLLDAALPAMRALADATGQSVHLSVPAGERLLVLAQAEGFADMGFSVKPGSLHAFDAGRSSARVIAAFGLDPPPAWPGLAAIRRAGALCAPSATVPGVTDIAAPVRDVAGRAVAAINLTWLARRDRGPARQAVPQVVAAAAAISAALGFRPG
jgi:DNA-binding IclR family transcriptional regulator